MRLLIVGCQRSGTTMLAALFARHPAVRVFDEPDSYRVLTSTTNTAGVFKIPRWGDLLPGPTDGDPDQRLSAPFEWSGEPMIHIVRDPLDVVASMSRLKRPGGTTWLDRYAIALTQCRLTANPAWNERLGWVMQVAEQERAWACAGAYWRIKNEAAIRHLDEGRPIHVVVYEDVVRERSALDGALAAVGIESLDRTLPSRLQRAAGGTDPQRAPDEASVGRGAQLPDVVKELVLTATGDLYSQLSALSRAPVDDRPIDE